MRQPKTSLWSEIFESTPRIDRCLADPHRRVWLRDLFNGTILPDEPENLAGKSVLLHMTSQIMSACAMIELDGRARRLIICPPDTKPAQLQDIITDTKPNAVVTDDARFRAPHDIAVTVVEKLPRETTRRPARNIQSEWLLFTSGTTGRPKAVVHDLASLTAPLRQAAQFPNAVWSTFYDIRRYGGLTILLRALLGGGSMVFSDSDEQVADFLRRVASFGVTHMSGTPSHWRQALMSGAAHCFRPDYVRLSGEPADQAILDMLQTAFASAKVSHAFASTEAGVAFDIRDGLAGFPADLLNQTDTGLDFKVANETLLIRSTRTASKYLRSDMSMHDADGFVNTGDIVELRGNRYFFTGRREGVINVGGLKVHPEEVEAIINRHSAVHMSLVHGRSSPITGALVVADVVIRPDYAAQKINIQTIKDEILVACRDALPPYKVPSRLREVPFLKLTPSGKLLRSHG